ncbi:MAG: hypothetical protein V7K77_25745 [Nostoc sp.]|uniref:hypothetical protein n=1 Tax=Nostoc sp. TaxID=1180 RepID=UPI002FF6DFBA
MTLSIFGYLGFLEPEFSRQWGCGCTHFTAFTKNSKNHRCNATGKGGYAIAPHPNQERKLKSDRPQPIAQAKHQNVPPFFKEESSLGDGRE